MKKFASELALGMMGCLTLFLVAVASEGDAMEGWIIAYCAGMALTSIVLMVYGLGDHHE